MESEASDTEDFDQDLEPSASMTVPESNDPEPGGLMFYHMDLYETRERLDIFPEEPSSRALGETGEESARIGEEFQRPVEMGYDVEKEVEELAKLYGLDEDKGIEGELLVGSIVKAGIIRTKETPVKMEGVAAGSSGSVHNAPKSHSLIKGAQPEKQSMEEQRLPEKGSQDENQHLQQAGGAREGLNSYVCPREDLKTYGMQNEPTCELNSKEEAADIYCSTCKTPIRAFDKLFGNHKDHEVTELTNAAEIAKVRSI